MNKVKLWVDDERDPVKFTGEDDWLWAKTYDQAIDALNQYSFEIISLDNDLGMNEEDNDDGYQGRHVFIFIEQLLFECNEKVSELKEVRVHSSNPVAVREIMSTKDNMRFRFNIQVSQTVL